MLTCMFACVTCTFNASLGTEAYTGQLHVVLLILERKTAIIRSLSSTQNL